MGACGLAADGSDLDVMDVLAIVPRQKAKEVRRTPRHVIEREAKNGTTKRAKKSGSMPFFRF